MSIKEDWKEMHWVQKAQLILMILLLPLLIIIAIGNWQNYINSSNQAPSTLDELTDKVFKLGASYALIMNHNGEIRGAKTIEDAVNIVFKKYKTDLEELQKR